MYSKVTFHKSLISTDLKQRTFNSIPDKINIHVRQAGDHLFGELLSSWPSLVISLMVSFRDVFFQEMSWLRF